MTQDQTPKKENQQKSEPPNPALRYSALGIQMAVIIGLAAWGGSHLDEKYQNKTPWFTITFILVGIFGSLYLVIKDVMKSNK